MQNFNQQIQWKTISELLFKYFIQEQAVAIRERSFTLNPWKLSVKRLIRNEVARCQPASLRKNSSTYLPSCILPSFYKNASRLLLPKRLLKCVSKIAFWKYKQNVVLLVIYLFSYDSCKSTSFMLNVTFDFVLSTVFV